MHLGLIPDGPAELKALTSRRVPVPFLETHFAFALARAVMAATKLGVFESLTLQAASSTEIASRCRTEPVATQKLLIALCYDYGVDTYDVVLLSHLAHHFSAFENADLFQRLGRALRPHGVFAVIEPIRPEPGDRAAQFAALDELYFGLSSRSGTWTARDIAGWQRDAGLVSAPQPIRLGGDDTGLQIATKMPHHAPQPLRLTRATPAPPQPP